MTTLSPTQARSNLTAWLKKAAQGEDVGILFGNHVIALRPVEVSSTDYAEREYGVTAEELTRALAGLHAKGKKNRKAGKSRRFTGDIEAVLKD
jgi:antitoxin (DNA-binding transcriptional repressor) of toxin-antitoxin stability system